MRQELARHLHEAGDVGGVLSLNLLIGGSLKGAERPVTGIVDQYVDLTESLQRLVERGTDGRGVGHVERQGENAVRCQIGVIRGRAHGRRDVPAFVAEKDGRGAAYSCRSSGDEDCLRHVADYIKIRALS